MRTSRAPSFCLTAFSGLLIAVFLSSCAPRSQKGPELVGKMAPWTRFTLMDGSARGLQEFKGQTLSIVFWSTWCHKSYRMLRKINAFADRVSGQKAVFMAVSIDKAENLEKVRERIHYNRLGNFVHAFSGNDVSDEAYVALDGDNLPYVLVVNPEGYIVAAGNSDEPIYQAFGIDPKSVSDVSEP